MIPFVLLLVVQAAAANLNPPATLAPITVYSGTWIITSPHTMAGPGKTDTLVNHCTLNEAFYACEQVVNGKPLALIIFTPTEKPNEFHTQAVLPDGHANGRGDLLLAGDHWTFNGKSVSDDGKTTTLFRTENYFTGRDRIHFDQFESTDGTTWQKKNEGDEIRSTTPHN